MVPEVYDFTEPDTSSQNLDILFMIHATGSFNGQLSTGVSSGLSSFVAALGSINYQIGVMLGYPSGSQSGTLFNSSKNTGVPAVLASSSMSISKIEQALQNDIADAPTDNQDLKDPGGQTISQVHGEFGTLSLLNALSAANFAASQKAGFFRSNAALAVVFAANEADNCFIGSDDDDALEASWKADFCAGMTAQKVVSAVQTAQGSNPYLFGFIGYETYPLNGGQKIDEEEAGDGYLDVANLAKGIVANLDPGNMVASSGTQATIIQNGLTNVGQLAQSKLMLTKTFMLDPGTVAATIMVYLNGTLQASSQWTYDLGTNSVTIPGVASKDMVEIRYYIAQ